MNNLVEVLAKREGMAEPLVIDWIKDVLEDAGDYDDYEELLADEFGLEPDYLFDLLEFVTPEVRG